MKCSSCKSIPTYTHTLTVQELTTTADDNGQIDANDDANWNTVASIRCRFETKRGDESPRTDTTALKQRVAYQDSVLFTPSTNVSRSLSPAQRLKMGTRIFNITASYLINETGREVQVFVTERRR